MNPSDERRFERIEATIAVLQARSASSSYTPDPVRWEVTGVLTFTSPAQVVLFSDLLKVGDAIRDVAIVVEDGFNDFATTISIGTTASPDLIVSASDLIPQVAGEYRVPRTYTAPINEPLFVFITPGTSTTGAFRVYFAYERA